MKSLTLPSFWEAYETLGFGRGMLSPGFGSAATTTTKGISASEINNKYKIAGGVRKSERKKPVRKAKA